MTADAKDIRPLISRLLASLDLPESQGQIDEYVTILLNSMKEKEDDPAPPTIGPIMTKIKSRITRERLPLIHQQLQQLAMDASIPLTNVLQTISLLLEDRAITALLATSRSSRNPLTTPKTTSTTPRTQTTPATTIPTTTTKTTTSITRTIPASASRPLSSAVTSTSTSTSTTSTVPSTASKWGTTSSTTTSTTSSTATKSTERYITPTKRTSSPSRDTTQPASTSTSLLPRPDIPHALTRPPEENDLVDLTYGEYIVLRTDDRVYLGLEEGSGKVVAQSTPHPFTLLNPRNIRDHSTVHLQDSVCLVTSTGHYLSAESNGSVSGHRTSFDTRTKWTLVSAIADDISSDISNVNAVGSISQFDRIALRSCFATYLTIDEHGITSSASNIRIPQTWRIASAAIPWCPDWIRQRSYVITPTSSTSTSTSTLPDNILADKSSDHILNALPTDVREQLLLEDLLYAMMGIEAKYIRMTSTTSHIDGTTRVRFHLSLAIRDRSIVEIMQKIIPICEYYVYLQNYVTARSRFEYGLIHHAFTSAIRVMLKEYLILIAQLESLFHKRQLTMTRVWYYVQPSMGTMERLYRITSLGAHVRGGALLHLLHTTIAREGDSTTRDLYTYLITCACAPYFHMLESWIYRGEIADVYHEFMIASREDLSKENVKQDFNDTYWDERYSIDTDRVPGFLSEVASRILTTGKYLNVIRECGRTIQCPITSKFRYSTNDRDYTTIIDSTYQWASQQLLHLLMNENNLMGRLRSIKRYFLMDQGDFFVHFMDIADEELNKPINEITTPKLHSLLELAIRTSKAISDPYHDDLSCFLTHYSLIQKMEALSSTQGDGRYNEQLSALITSDRVTMSGRKIGKNIDGDIMSIPGGAMMKGVESFVMAYRVRWPLSLLISKKTLTKYQLIFRHLFHVKHVERMLCRTWRNHQSVKELHLKSAFNQSFCLRQRMLHFMQNFSYYMMAEVIEPKWQSLETKLKSVTTVDQVLEYHQQFLNQCLKECLLTNGPLLKLLTKLMSTCLLFAENIERFTASIQLDNETYLNEPDRVREDRLDNKPDISEEEAAANAARTMQRRNTKIKVESNHIQTIARSPQYVKMIQEFVKNFDDKLHDFLIHLRDKSATSYDNHLTNLFTRLDYNGFYSQ